MNIYTVVGIIINSNL